MANDIDSIRQSYAAEMGDLIEEIASGRGVLVHNEFLRAVVANPQPQTAEQLSARTKENLKNTQSRIQVFVKSSWMSTDSQGGTPAYYIDLPAFLPARTDRMFDTPGRVQEFKDLLAAVESQLGATSGPEREELEAMQRSLAGVVPPLEQRAKELDL